MCWHLAKVQPVGSLLTLALPKAVRLEYKPRQEVLEFPPTALANTVAR